MSLHLPLLQEPLPARCVLLARILDPQVQLHDHPYQDFCRLRPFLRHHGRDSPLGDRLGLSANVWDRPAFYLK
jgi:hypothetical protein